MEGLKQHQSSQQLRRYSFIDYFPIIGIYTNMRRNSDIDKKTEIEIIKMMMNPDLYMPEDPWNSLPFRTKYEKVSFLRNQALSTITLGVGTLIAYGAVDLSNQLLQYLDKLFR